MFFYKKIYNLIIIFTLIILTCLNNKCDPDKITESLSKSQSKLTVKSVSDLYSILTKDEVTRLQQREYQWYKDAFNIYYNQTKRVNSGYDLTGGV